ncbi:PepSY domain-containing protein [Candidatus Woesearchaeota archaeon]|nr:PepSY domain-containing protein [Candidatus Woesearchaeota archaeon]
MLEFKQAISKLHQSQLFRDFQFKDAKAYLTNSVYIDEWQINYFSPKTNMITTFIVNGKVSKKTLDSNEMEFPQLNMAKLKIDIGKILEIAKKFIKEKETKIIIILQAENSTPIWNISAPLMSLKIIHIKISAETGDIIENTEKNIIEIRR